jgi:hypothetical protein
MLFVELIIAAVIAFRFVPLVSGAVGPLTFAGARRPRPRPAPGPIERIA